MSRRLPVLAGVAALACAAAFASLPARADRVAWSVTIGGPGFAVSAGQPWGGFVAAPAVRPVVAPWAPVAGPWTPVVAPAPVVLAPPMLVAAPVVPVVRPVRWRHARPVIVVPPAFVPAPVVVRPW